MSEATGQSEGGVDLAGEFVAQARQQLAFSVSLVRHCVGQLDEGQVWWRPREGMNSVANLLLHLAGNLRQRIASQVGGEADVRDRPAEFTERGPLPKAEVLGRFESAAARADEVLAGLTAARLGETCRYEVLAGPTERSVLGVIFQTLTHLNGHAQEILHLTRAQLGDAYTFRQPAGVPPRPAARG
ncbi:DinB superfamily protein [Aquisphaera giovannonii]|uniref:DinB superfamily protein n=1 Tax=Aquisphaera giovannonii TaxID=406548 RepID=A0A5B9W4L2_9BACT|nr:DinB family protein [Aquisphaera giovannonii]QEH35573.1 DinB superfamily protein [Aquisphaera giovannonii]